MGVDTVDSLCQRAREAIEQRSWDKARDFYRQALALKADAPDVHYGLATVCFQMRDLPNAAHHFKEVTRLDPLRPGAYINLGAVYNLLDQLDDAIPVLRRGIQLDSHRAEGYYNLGLVYRRKKQLDMAVQAYQEAVRVNPRMADAHYNLANCFLERDQVAHAINHYRTALQLRPNWDKAVHGLANAEAKQAAQGKPGKAASSTEIKAADTTAPVQPPSGFEPERQIDPTVHGNLLHPVHNAVVDSENLGRELLRILETEVEPAIKELSSCLLMPDTSTTELDQCVDKFQAAQSAMKKVQSDLQANLEKVRNLGIKLLRS